MSLSEHSQPHCPVRVLQRNKTDRGPCVEKGFIRLEHRKCRLILEAGNVVIWPMMVDVLAGPSLALEVQRSSGYVRILKQGVLTQGRLDELGESSFCLPCPFIWTATRRGHPHSV